MARLSGISFKSALLIYKTLPFRHYRYVFNPIAAGNSSRAAGSHLTSLLESIKLSFPPAVGASRHPWKEQCNQNYVCASRLNSPEQKSGWTGLPPTARLPAIDFAHQVSAKTPESDLYASVRCQTPRLLRPLVRAYSFTSLRLARCAGLETYSETLFRAPSATPGPSSRLRAPRRQVTWLRAPSFGSPGPRS